MKIQLSNEELDFEEGAGECWTVVSSDAEDALANRWYLATYKLDKSDSGIESEDHQISSMMAEKCRMELALAARPMRRNPCSLKDIMT